MTYLLSQYWIFIALSFLLGLFVGWATCGGGQPDDGRSGWLAWALAAFLAGVFLALFKVVPGVAGHLLEVALLLFGGYVAGCMAGCGGHWAAAGPGDAVAPRTSIVAPASASTSAPFTHDDVIGIDSSASYPGARPDALWFAQGRADDLTAIGGVSAPTAKALNDIGVFHNAQIAKWGGPEIAWVEHHLSQPGVVGAGDWVGQAARLMQPASTEAASLASQVAREIATPTAPPSPRTTDTPAVRTPDAPDASAPRAMTDGARSILAQQRKAAAHAANATIATSVSSAEDNGAAHSRAPAQPAVAQPVVVAPRIVPASRAPMTDGARSIAVLKRKQDEAAARRAAAGAATTAQESASPAPGAAEHAIAHADDDGRPPANASSWLPADDLKLIKGIGPKNEAALAAIDVVRFAQIAEWTSANAAWVGAALAFPGRIEREKWIDQARFLAAGVDTPHSAAVKSGAVVIDETADAPMSDADAEALERSLPRQAAQVENEGGYSGARPLGLADARGGAPDDLKLIKGIGKQNEARLHALGVWHFDQIAGWSPENVTWIGSYLAFPGRIDRERWIEQAADFAKRTRA